MIDPPCSIRRAAERPDQVDLEHAEPLGDVGVDHRAERPDTRIGEGDLDAAEPLGRLGKEGVDLGLAADVARTAGHGVTQLCRPRCRAFALDVADHHACALGGEAPRRGEADTRSTAGDDGDLSGKPSDGHGSVKLANINTNL
jgi:hypothetical protein